jgi:hypothetical protein
MLSFVMLVLVIGAALFVALLLVNSADNGEGRRSSSWLDDDD